MTTIITSGQELQSSSLRQQPTMPSNSGHLMSIGGPAILNRARMLLSQRSTVNGNMRALNLIRLAEIAFKNGKPDAADDFARQAIALLEPPGKVIQTRQALLPSIPRKSEHTHEIKKPEQTVHYYKDKSSDVGVSFSYPAKLTGPQSFIAVPAHEYEHVRRRIGEAWLEGERVLVYVSYKLRYDPATGQAYLAGGKTTSINLSKYKPQIPEKHRVDMYA
jgi:hypothetical protein